MEIFNKTIDVAADIIIVLCKFFDWSSKKSTNTHERKGVRERQNFVVFVSSSFFFHSFYHPPISLLPPLSLWANKQQPYGIPNIN